MPLDTANLVKRFRERPFWIQEAARRLLTKENLTLADLSELTAVCRQQGGEPKAKEKPAALPESAFVKKASDVSLRLSATSEVKGIEALNPRSPLTFNHEPLTIVYGGTGVGKSGYIRILNNVCGSKNRRKLLGNVFQGNAAQSCKISYALNGTAKEIAFTHRLSMLTHLEDAARQAGIATRVVALNREPWGVGEPGETPFAARKPEKVINALLNERLARAKKILADNGKAEYDLHAKAICSDVRILVERLVEDTLLNEVVRRFRRAVHTQNKIGGLAKIKPEDCQMIDELMTKYSRYEHSQSNEAPVPLPEPDDITADLTRLQTWLKEFSESKIPQPVAKP